MFGVGVGGSCSISDIPLAGSCISRCAPLPPTSPGTTQWEVGGTGLETLSRQFDTTHEIGRDVYKSQINQSRQM